MFAKLTTVFGLVALAAQVVVATPPACVIAAVNQVPDPADTKAVCQNDKVASYISSKCGDNIDAANSYYADVCKDAGVTVSSSQSSTIGSQTASVTGTHGPHMTAFPTETLSGGNAVGTAPTASGTSGSSASQTTGAGGAQSTGAASRLGMDLVGLAALGVFGAMLAL
ncbi:hypothetical protein DOTSEDRAFT_72108 [Dothistroma septosporum NZE10]|uniref:Extracellular membrane protein CFEM domain-containing protein n=1 Tax=Dothistroma septosporum (strain NZE10 / CBS 128990) TaxID=675120 RepID=N1PQ29_DOTSN|nr:hypothetical protein DOTSEDRAFT_72108 [Dothistroma septosporum NZE10]